MRRWKAGPRAEWGVAIRRWWIWILLRSRLRNIMVGRLGRDKLLLLFMLLTIRIRGILRRTIFFTLLHRLSINFFLGEKSWRRKLEMTGVSRKVKLLNLLVAVPRRWWKNLLIISISTNLQRWPISMKHLLLPLLLKAPQGRVMHQDCRNSTECHCQRHTKS